MIAVSWIGWVSIGLARVFVALAMLPVVGAEWLTRRVDRDRHLCAILLTIGLALIMVPRAYAAETVVVPWGDWVASLLGDVPEWAILAVVAFALRKLPEPILYMITQWRIDRLLTRALTFGLNSIAGAAEGQTLTREIGNQVVARMLEYAIANAPKLVEEIGSSEMLLKIWARIRLDENASLPAPAEFTAPAP